MAQIFIAVFRPLQGNFRHWSIYFQSKREGTIFEVQGEHGTFTRAVVQENLEGIRHLIENILVATIDERDIASFKRIVAEAKVDNDTVEWNCQDYVLETLETLSQECIIDEDEDEDYREGISLAKTKYYGPM